MLKLSMGVLFLGVLILSSAAGIKSAAAEEGILVHQVAIPGQNYCHIKYMAFKADTLHKAVPELNPDDVVDFYGSCSFNPHSKEEIQRQIVSAAWFQRDGQDDSGGGDSND